MKIKGLLLKCAYVSGFLFAGHPWLSESLSLATKLKLTGAGLSLVVVAGVVQWFWTSPDEI